MPHANPHDFPHGLRHRISLGRRVGHEQEMSGFADLNNSGGLVHIRETESFVYPVDISCVNFIICAETMTSFNGGGVMACVKTRIFKSNRSQAVRLPREVAFPDSVKDVEITAVGNKRMIEPVGQSWDEWFNAPGVSNDFMIERKQPEEQRRETMGC